MYAFIFAAISGTTTAAATGDPYWALAATVIFGIFGGITTAMAGEQS